MSLLWGVPLHQVRRFQGLQESIDAELSEQKERLAQESHRHHSVVNDLERKHVQVRHSFPWFWNGTTDRHAV